MEDEGRHEAVAIPAPPPPRPAPIRPLRAAWTFEAGADQCIATAAAGATSLRVTVRRGAQIQLTVALASDPGAASAAARFAGAAGRWQAQTRRAGARQYAASLGADNTALSHVLMLLSGGTLDFGPPDRAIASLTIPPSDTGGQNWFDCAREKMF